MADVQQTVEQADHKMQRHACHIVERPWVEQLGRFGYAAKGIVYGLIGVLAVQAAIGAGGAITDTQGALQTVDGQPFGRFLLVLIAIGLVGYCIWRFVQAALDTENKGAEPKGIATRIGYVISGLAYSGFAIVAVRLAMDIGSQNNTTGMVAQIMSLPLGRVLVGFAGLIIIGVGGYEAYKGVSRGFEKELNTGKMSAGEQTWARRSGIVGLIAHGVVFGLTGLFLVVAALQHRPEQVQGLGGALQALAGQPFGPFLLAVVAVGLVAYGIFSLVQARYRRMIFS